MPGLPHANIHRKLKIILFNFNMASQFCNRRLTRLAQLVSEHYETFMFAFSLLNVLFSLVAVTGNLLAIRALWKASSIPTNLKTFFLSLAFSDLAVGLVPQLMLGVTIAGMLKMTANGIYNFAFLCPTILNVGYFCFFLLTCASFSNVSAIAVDRFLAVSLHLRYQELVTSKRVNVALVTLWLTSGVAATIFISLPNNNSIVVASVEIVGLLLTSVAYFRIYKVVRYHRNQIQSQAEQSNVQAMELARQKKSALNTLFVYVVFIANYLPNLCSQMFLLTKRLQISFLLAEHVTLFLVLLNSSLNPVVYCWRYREIRQIMQRSVKKIFRIN